MAPDEYIPAINRYFNSERAGWELWVVYVTYKQHSQATRCVLHMVCCASQQPETGSAAPLIQVLFPISSQIHKVSTKFHRVQKEIKVVVLCLCTSWIRHMKVSYLNVCFMSIIYILQFVNLRATIFVFIFLSCVIFCYNL